MTSGLIPSLGRPYTQRTQLKIYNGGIRNGNEINNTKDTGFSLIVVMLLVETLAAITTLRGTLQKGNFFLKAIIVATAALNPSSAQTLMLEIPESF